MTKAEYEIKRKEYKDAQEGEEFLTYYEENEEFCGLMGEIINIEEILDEQLVSVMSPNDYEIELDDKATTLVLIALREMKDRKIEEF